MIQALPGGPGELPVILFFLLMHGGIGAVVVLWFVLRGRDRD